MKKRGRLIIVLLVLVACGVFLYPTIKWYALVPQETKDLATGTNQQIREYALGQASRELRELKELVQANPTAAVPDEYKFVIDMAKANYKTLKLTAPKTWTIADVFKGFVSEDAMFAALEGRHRDELLALKKTGSSILQLGLDLRGGMSILLDADIDAYEAKTGKTASASEISALVQQDIEILQARIDQFGVTEPDIRLQGNNQILIEIPGVADPERVNSFLRGKGSLSFQIIDESLTSQVNGLSVYDLISETGEIIQPEFLPAGKKVVGYYETDEYGLDVLMDFVVINEEVDLDGIHLIEAVTSTDAITGKPVVNFELDSVGGDIFYKLTSTNIGKTLAVVMDGKVKARATISEAIRDSVRISGFTADEAADLAIVLRTAALPIELIVSSQQVVGATLGQDAVEIGLKAVAIGLALIMVFMFVYYGASGLVADLALGLNLVMMLAILSAFNFTLTLTSIAGLILTIGMAVDANVIIFERIKEELRTGKSHQASIRAGFSKAFWTVMDSNLTTIIAALVLSQLGSTAVKGFANTLMVGIVCSLFTALFVSHLIFDATVTDRPDAKLHISWREI